MLDNQLELTDKIGYLLLKKGIIDVKVLEKALHIKQSEDNKIKRNLAQILVQDLGFDHDAIFREVAILYAFRELNIQVDQISDKQKEEIKQLITSQGEEVKQVLLKHKVIPYKYDDRIKDKLILAATDPTDKSLSKIAYSLNAKKYEIIYMRMRDYEKLIALLFLRK
jgi:type IV pilus assembly protein PilB